MKCSAITGPIFEQHDREGHVESQDRLLSIIRQLPDTIPRIRPATACCEDIERVHLPGYLSWLRNQCERNADYDLIRDYGYNGGFFTQNTIMSGFIDQNTYINPHSYEVATYAAGSAITAVKRTLDGESCFALVRPPGHHAAAAWAMGFCLLNNAAIAAAKALTMADRVAIIDWDVHHGNGTQDIFYGDDRVLYCSVHQNDTFPHTGAVEETGTGAGRGYTVNAPIPRRCGIADYTQVFTRVFLPMVDRMKPDLLIISAGQDILSDDPVGDMRIHPADMGYLTGLVCDAVSMPLALVLEGGYGPSHGEAVREIFGALKGERLETAGGPVHKKTLEVVEKLCKIHRIPKE